MSAFDHNPYSSLDEDTSYETQNIYATDSEEEDSLYSFDAQAEWEESKEQLSALFSLVIFPFVGKWLGKKFSFWGKGLSLFLCIEICSNTKIYFNALVWSRCFTKTPFTQRYAILSSTSATVGMMNSIKKIA